jgi:hypothetical protein
MNNRETIRALELFRSGHTLKEVASMVGVELKEVKLTFGELEVVDGSTATSALKEIEEEKEKQKSQDLSGLKRDLTTTPDFERKLTPYLHKYDRERVVERLKNEIYLEIPLEHQQTMRRDFRNKAWKDFSKKWKTMLNISEPKLKEQVKLLSPIQYKDTFGE